MIPYTFFTAGSSPALKYARRALERRGYGFIDHFSPDITHLLLPVPSLAPDGTIKGGGRLEDLLPCLPESIAVIGGNIRVPGYQTIDLLQDPFYLAENAAITAHCAISLAAEKLPVVLAGCPVLIIGWGRIAKCLALLLKGLGAEVTVAARKEADRAMAQALGLNAAEICHPLSRYRVIFNTAPAPVISDAQKCREDCLKIELASQLGIAGEDVIWARGLPGKDAPESSGELIAATIIKLLEKG